MSTFAELAARTSVGCAYFLECSSDSFVTVTRYSTHTGKLDGTNMMEPRIKNLGNLTRGLGADFGMTASTVSLTLSNEDGALDWLADQSTFATVLKTRFKLWCMVYDPADVTNYATKQLGTFACLDNPRRTPDAIELSLTDNSLADLANLGAVPTLRDWYGVTDLNRPAEAEPTYSWPAAGVNYDAPLPLYFGSNPMPVTRVGGNVYVVCACNDGCIAEGAVSFDQVFFGNGQQLMETFPVVNSTAVTLYTAGASPIITKGGRDWRILWLNAKLLDVDIRGAADAATYKVALANALYTVDKLPNHNAIYDLVGPITIRDHRLSRLYNQAAALTAPGDHAADVAYDLIATYSSGLTSADIVSAGFTSAKASQPGNQISGVIQQGLQTTTSDTYAGTLRHQVSEEVNGGDLIKALQGICQAGQFDLFFDWDGKVRCAPSVSDFNAQTATLVALDETLLKLVEERMPSAGERHAPFNRLYVIAGGQRYGPLDNAAARTAWGRWITKTIDGSWTKLQVPLQALNTLPIFPNLATRFSNLDGTTLRPQLRVSYPMLPAVSTLELGDYVTLAWSRGVIGGPYASTTVWRVEGISADLASQMCMLDLCWANDLRSSTNLPYLLDDETLLNRATGSGGRTITVTTGSSTILFSSGSLITDGIAAGDMLVVQDSTEAASSFFRNRVVRVASITDATHLVYTGSTDWDAGGPFTTSAWKLQRGALTYPTAISDPTNYPSGGTMYGKVSDSAHAGKFSDNSTAANVLLEG